MFRMFAIPATVAALAFGGCAGGSPTPRYEPPVTGQVGVCFGIPGGCPTAKLTVDGHRLTAPGVVTHAPTGIRNGLQATRTPVVISNGIRW